MEEKLKIKMSEIYDVLRDLDASQGLGLYDRDVINNEVLSSNNALYERFGKLNQYTQSLIEARRIDDVEKILESLIYMRIHVMNFASEFDNLREDVDKLIKHYS